MPKGPEEGSRGTGEGPMATAKGAAKQVASWGIVMTVREPAQLVMANLGWHLGAGASEIHVYFDDPEDLAIPMTAPLAEVRAIRCDDAHWAEIAPSGKRPPTHRRRQGLNANHALARCEVDWLIHLDADEFLVQSRPLGEEMAAVRDLKCELYFPVAERVFHANTPARTIFDGAFRLCTRTMLRRGDGLDNEDVIFGDQKRFLDYGMLGHSAGKCAVPWDAGFRLGIHWAHLGKTRRRAERFRSASTRLLHFDGLTRLHWLAKLRRYAMYDPTEFNTAAHRQAQVDLAREMADVPGGYARIHAELKEASTEQLDRFRAFGLIDDRPFDPAPVLRDVLGYVPDLSVEAFDEALREVMPERTEGLS